MTVERVVLGRPEVPVPLEVKVSWAVPDFAPAVYNVISSLAKALGFRMDSPHNGTQPKFLSDSLPEVLNAPEGMTTNQELTKRLDENGCAYIAGTNAFVVR